MANDNGGHSTDSWQDEDLVSVVKDTSGIDASRRSLLAFTGAGFLGMLFSGTGSVSAQESDSLNAKTRTTIWTDEMRENAQQNIQQYDWAASQRDDAVTAADDRLDRLGPGLDSLWGLVTSQDIPRGGGQVNQREILGGTQDSGDDRRWKMETAVNDPNGEGNFVLPTNDFEAYRQSGLDEAGKFDSDLADDSLLVNEEHPEMGEGWGVDDGWGWVDEDDDLGDGPGTRWNPVAYYNHWHVWRPGGILALLRDLTDAYLLTGDKQYSRAGTVLLDRIADVYPDMWIGDYMQSDGFWNSHGGRQTGKAVGAFWEDNFLRPVVRAYDAFFPGMEGDDELVAFLDAKTDEFTGLDDKDSIEKIRTNIEDGILREVLPAAEASNIVVGSGALSAITQAARVLDEPDGYTREALEWVFQPGGEYFDGDTWNEEPENWYTTGGNVVVPLVDVCDRDGYYELTAPHYNRIPQNAVREVADYLNGYDAFDGADLYQHPKLRQSLLQNSHLLLIDEFTPQLGDAHGPTSIEWSGTAIEEGFKLTGEPIYAQLWHYQNDYSTSGIRGSIYDPDPEGLAEQVQAVIDAEGPLNLPSQNLAGYGFAALRDGENYLNQSFGTTHDTSDLFVDASTEINDSFEEAIQLQAYEEGESWTFEFDIDGSGEHDFEIDALWVGTYGIYELYINDEFVDTVDFYADSFTQDSISYTVDLVDGGNEMRWENVGKNADSDDYLMALYSMTVISADERENWEAAKELGNAKRALWMYYGRTGIDAGGSTHNHGDALGIGLAANELELSPDLGYPERTGDWPKHDFTKGTISHNTVTVDQSRQAQQWVATPRHFEGDDDRVNLIDVDARHSYDQCKEYRRTTAMISANEGHSYAVDFFRVRGGDDHVFSFHGQIGEATAEGVNLVAQDGGTYAGPDVSKPDYGEDAEYNQDVGSGFNYLTNVERDDDPGPKIAVDWDIEDFYGHRDDDAEGVHMRLTSFGDFDEVALADGHPPDRDGNTDTLPYALIRRQGSDLSSDFVSTIEHWDGDRVVESVEEVPVTGGDANAVKVELTTGRTDYVVCSFDDTGTITVDDTFEFEGYFGVYSVEDGESEYAYVHDGTTLQPSQGPSLIEDSHGEARGWVEDFTTEMSLENELSARIAPGRKDVDRHAGFVYVDNDDSNPWRSEPDPEEPIASREQRGRGNGAYPIEDLEGGDGNRVTIKTDQRTFVREFSDPDQLKDGGYEHAIAMDDDLRIPLTSSWSWPEVEVSGLAESATHPSFEISSAVPLEITGFSIETTGDLAAVEQTKRPHTDRTHNVFVYQAGIAYESEEPIQLDGTEYAFDTTGEVTNSRVQLERFSWDSGISLEGVVDSREQADLVVTFVLADGTELPVFFDASSGA